MSLTVLKDLQPTVVIITKIKIVTFYVNNILIFTNEAIMIENKYIQIDSGNLSMLNIDEMNDSIVYLCVW